MDLSEITSYQPNVDLDQIGQPQLASGKRKRLDDDVGGDASVVNDERARALRLMAQDSEEASQGSFRTSDLKRLVLSFEKKSAKNQELRVKHAVEPTRFLESELELHASIGDLKAASTAPELYPDLIATGVVEKMVETLGHENSDVVTAVVELIHDLTDPETLEDEEESLKLLVESLLKAHLLPALVLTLRRFTEPDDSDAIHQSLGIFENIIEVNPAIAGRTVSESDLLSWILVRVMPAKGKKFDNNKLYASEILSILLQDSSENRLRLGQMSVQLANGREVDGIDVILRCLQQYKKRDPVGAEEIELMENLFNVFYSLLTLLMLPVACSLLSLSENRRLFVAAEGIDLMILILQEHKLSQYGALKVLDHAMSGSLGAPACAIFVERLGLKSLFPVFMKTPSAKKKIFTKVGFEEHVVSIIASLFGNLNTDGSLDRVLRKFIEQDYAKIERLVELHLSYSNKVRICEIEIEKEKFDLAQDGEEMDDVTENEHYIKRLDAGLYTLQHVDIIIGEICVKCGSQARERIRQLIKLKGGTMASVASVVEEFVANMDYESAEDEERFSTRKKHLKDLCIVL